MALPTGYAGYLTNDTAAAVVLTSVIHPQPRMTTLRYSGTNLVMVPLAPTNRHLGGPTASLRG